MGSMVELTEAELAAVAGGCHYGGGRSSPLAVTAEARDAGMATFTFTDTATGTTARVTGTLNISTTPTSASISGTFTSSSS